MEPTIWRNWSKAPVAGESVELSASGTLVVPSSFEDLKPSCLEALFNSHPGTGKGTRNGNGEGQFRQFP